MTKTGLFIGRFQPFHKGHMLVVKEIFKEVDTLIIGIGSSQESHTSRNPFTAEERENMINEVMLELSPGHFSMIQIPDINNYPKWVAHVKDILHEFDVVFTRNPLTKELFDKEGYAIRKPLSYEIDTYSGSEIRRRMASDEGWKHLVPDVVVNVIEKIDGVSRVRSLTKSGDGSNG